MERDPMTTRRGNGEGTIKQRSDGRWEAQLSLPSGKRKSVYGKTKKEVRDKLKDVQKRLDDGVDLGAPSQTLEAFLESWVADSKARVRPKTHRTYQDLLRLHVIPELGKVRLDRVARRRSPNCSVISSLRDCHQKQSTTFEQRYGRLSMRPCAGG
jgi:hypothetical protein